MPRLLCQKLGALRKLGILFGGGALRLPRCRMAGAKAGNFRAMRTCATQMIGRFSPSGLVPAEEAQSNGWDSGGPRAGIEGWCSSDLFVCISDEWDSGGSNSEEWDSDGRIARIISE